MTSIRPRADACEALCGVVSECEGVSQSDCEEACEEELDDAAEISSSCASTYGELMGCIAELSCDEYDDYWEEPTADYPCHRDDEAVASACDDDDGPEPEPEPEPEPDPDPQPQPDEDECDYDSQCGYHEICVGGSCQYADCTSDAHCSGCNRCVSNYCSYCGEGPYGCYC